MNYYFEPCNVKQWNIFEKVSGVGQIEPFFATKDMKIGDILLHYVGKQSKKYKPGVYAISKIIKEPYVFLKDEGDPCQEHLTFDAEVICINFNMPLIIYEEVKEFNGNFRRVHKIIADKYDIGEALKNNNEK